MSGSLNESNLFELYCQREEADKLLNQYLSNPGLAPQEKLSLLKSALRLYIPLSNTLCPLGLSSLFQQIVKFINLEISQLPAAAQPTQAAQETQKKQITPPAATAPRSTQPPQILLPIPKPSESEKLDTLHNEAISCWNDYSTILDKKDLTLKEAAKEKLKTCIALYEQTLEKSQKMPSQPTRHNPEKLRLDIETVQRYLKYLSDSFFLSMEAESYWNKAQSTEGTEKIEALLKSKELYQQAKNNITEKASPDELNQKETRQRIAYLDQELHSTDKAIRDFTARASAQPDEATLELLLAQITTVLNPDRTLSSVDITQLFENLIASEFFKKPANIALFFSEKYQAQVKKLEKLHLLASTALSSAKSDLEKISINLLALEFWAALLNQFQGPLEHLDLAPLLAQLQEIICSIPAPNPLFFRTDRAVHTYLSAISKLSRNPQSWRFLYQAGTHVFTANILLSLSQDVQYSDCAVLIKNMACHSQEAQSQLSAANAITVLSNWILKTPLSNTTLIEVLDALANLVAYHRDNQISAFTPSLILKLSELLFRTDPPTSPALQTSILTFLGNALHDNSVTQALFKTQTPSIEAIFKFFITPPSTKDKRTLSSASWVIAASEIYQDPTCSISFIKYSRTLQMGLREKLSMESDARDLATLNKALTFFRSSVESPPSQPSVQKFELKSTLDPKPKPTPTQKPLPKNIPGLDPDLLSSDSEDDDSEDEDQDKKAPRALPTPRGAQVLSPSFLGSIHTRRTAYTGGAGAGDELNTLIQQLQNPISTDRAYQRLLSNLKDNTLNTAAISSASGHLDLLVKQAASYAETNVQLNIASFLIHAIQQNLNAGESPACDFKKLIVFLIDNSYLTVHKKYNEQLKIFRGLVPIVFSQFTRLNPEFLAACCEHKDRLITFIVSTSENTLHSLPGSPKEISDWASLLLNSDEFKKTLSDSDKMRLNRLVGKVALEKKAAAASLVFSQPLNPGVQRKKRLGEGEDDEGKDPTASKKPK